MHCELCDTTDEEDETHFLTSCERMTDIRNRHMPQILQLIPDDGRTEIADSKILLTHLILDAGRPEVTSILPTRTRVSNEGLHLRSTRQAGSNTKAINPLHSATT